MNKIYECQITDDTEKGHFIGRLMDYPTDKQPVWVSIIKLEDKAKETQKSLFHVFVGEIVKKSPHIGNGIVLSFASWKNQIKEFGLEKKEYKKINGESDWKVPSINELNKSELTEFISWMQKWAHEFFGGEIILVSNKEK